MPLVLKNTYDPAEVCPKCGTSLGQGTYNKIKIQSCPRCHGSVAEQGCLEQLVKDHDEYLSLTPDQGGNPHFEHPGCGGTFHQYSVNSSCSLKLDVCDKCNAVWFDADELQYANHMHEVVDAKKRIDEKFTWRKGLFVFLTRLPYEYNSKPRATPWALYGIIIINIIVFLLQESDPYFEPYFIPAAPFGIGWLWSMIESMFAHGGLFHIASNMYFLWLFGDNVEDVLGPVKFLLFYIGGGIAGDLVHAGLTAEPQIPCLGASGAVMAVMGAYLVYFRRARFTMPMFIPVLHLAWLVPKARKVPPLVIIGIYILMDIIGAVYLDYDGVGHWAHLGGMAFGIAFGLITYNRVLENNVFLKILNTQETA